MIYATIQKNNITYKYRWLLKFKRKSAVEVNKDLEKLRTFFSQNFEICQWTVLCRPER